MTHRCKLVKFYKCSSDNTSATLHYGFRLPDGNIICACCGGIFSSSEILASYDIDFVQHWLNLDNIIQEELEE